jgi:hypothetical protein
MLWAVMLMMAILFVPSFFMKRPPPRPVTPAAQVPVDSPAMSGAAGVSRAARRQRLQWLRSDVAAPADTISVTTPLARYGVSTRGAVITSLDLVKYRSTAPATKDAPAELIRPGSPLLGLTVISGADTLHLDQWDFQVQPSSLNVTGEPASLTLTSARAGHSVSIRYTFSPNDYQVGVAGTVSGVGSAGGQLVLGLATGLANTEADSVDNYRAAALVTYGGSAERHDPCQALRGGDDGLEWTVLLDRAQVEILRHRGAGLRFHLEGSSAASRRPHCCRRASVPRRRDPASHADRHLGRVLVHVVRRPDEYDRLKRIGHDFDDVNPYGLPGLRTLIRFFASPVRWLLCGCTRACTWATAGC